MRTAGADGRNGCETRAPTYDGLAGLKLAHQTNQYERNRDFGVASLNRHKLLVKSVSQAIMIGLVIHDFGHQRDAQKTPKEMDSDARQGASESLIEDFW